MKKNYINFIKLVFVSIWMLAGSQMLMAQSGTIKGTVIDESNNTIPGANVVIVESNFGTATDSDGAFTLNNVAVGEQKIEVSFLGFQSQTKVVTIVNGQTAELMFTLVENNLTLGEITVTASKRSENIQDVPQSISAVTSRGLEDIGATSANDYLNTLPGVNMQSPNPSENQITIRGISPEAGWASAVGFYLDETPITEFAIQPSVTSFDIERIEVLRGPQGTLYGEGSMGGTIKVIPFEPNVNKMEFKFDPEFSNTSNGGLNYKVNGMANVPIIKNKLAVRATGFYQNDDGYIDNVGLDIKKVNTFETYGARFAAKYIATKKLVITASALISKSKIGGQFVANTDLKQTTSTRETMNDNMSLVNLNAYYDFSFASLTITGSYYERKTDQVVDLGFFLPEANGLFEMFGIEPRTGLWTKNNSDYKVMSAETRLVSSGNGPLKWTVGAFYKNYDMSSKDVGDSEAHLSGEEVSFIVETIFGIPGITESFYNDNTRKIQQAALFAEVSYDITEKLNILGGIRLFNEQRNFSSYSTGLFPILMSGGFLPLEEVTEKGSENVVNPKVTLTFKPNNNIITYITASKGFRSGGQNVYAYLFEGAPTSYGAETLWNYEFGVKSVLFNNKVIANAAIFYNNWTNMQVRTRSYASLTATENVGKAHTSGVDIDISWMPLKGLLFSANGNYTIGKTDDVFNLPAGVDENTGEELYEEVPKGTQLPFVPEYGINLASQYKFKVGKGMFLTPRVDYNYTGKSTTALLYSEENPAYQTINLRISYEYKWVEVYAFADNVTDERVKQTYWYDDVDLGTMYAMGRPRTIGIGFRTRF